MSEPSSAAAEPAKARPRGRRRRLPGWAEGLLLVVFAIIVAMLIKTFLLQAFYIPSGSMKPGLRVDDRILVQKVSYWFGGQPERGDVIVFEDPGNWLRGEERGPGNPVAKGLSKIGLYPTGGHLVKRVIGVPGDTITCCDTSGQLEVNGVAVDESDFIAPQTRCDGPMPDNGACDWQVGPLPKGQLFVMGDNRSASADSSARLCGKRPDCDPDRAYVPIDLVVGKVFALVWPVGHAHLIHRPHAFDEVPNVDPE